MIKHGHQREKRIRTGNIRSVVANIGEWKNVWPCQLRRFTVKLKVCHTNDRQHRRMMFSQCRLRLELLVYYIIIEWIGDRWCLYLSSFLLSTIITSNEPWHTAVQKDGWNVDRNDRQFFLGWHKSILSEENSSWIKQLSMISFDSRPARERATMSNYRLIAKHIEMTRLWRSRIETRDVFT